MAAAVEYLLDASALLAFLLDERGGEVVQRVLRQSAITSVNLYEVLTKAAQVGVGWDEAAQAIRLLGVTIIPFAEEDVYQAGVFGSLAWRGGYSLGDRICLSSGAQLNVIVLTADRKWLEVSRVRVKLIR